LLAPSPNEPGPSTRRQASPRRWAARSGWQARHIAGRLPRHPDGALFGEATAEFPSRDATTPGEPPSGPDPGAIARIAELKRAGEGLDLEGDR